jgi:hypothetical protein
MLASSFSLPIHRGLLLRERNSVRLDKCLSSTGRSGGSGLYDPPEISAVLLCSHEWQRDAQRISTLISSSSNHAAALAEEAPLKELVLRDLALLHVYQLDPRRGLRQDLTLIH